MNHEIFLRVDMLERTILDLGTQLFELKGRLAKSLERQESFRGLLQGLKHLLDEKGVLSQEDFDEATHLGGAVGEQSAGELGLDQWKGIGKKDGH